MAHFAKLDENNSVIDVLVVDNENLQNLPFPESEPLGIELLTALTGHSKWKQTSYNANFRKNYTGVNGVYDEIRDAFIPGKPFSSWVLNEETCRWEAPISCPGDHEDYDWDETTQTWVLLAG
jgi:hypothetical protein